MKIQLREPLISGWSRCEEMEAAFGAPQHADHRGTWEVLQMSRSNQSRTFFISTDGKVFLTFGGVNTCTFLWRWDCARCLEFARITSWPRDTHRDVTAVLKLLIKCFVQAQIYSRHTDIGSSIIFQRPYGNPYLFLWKQMENHCIWRLLGGGGFFLSIFLSSWLQLFFKWRCTFHGWNRCKHVSFEKSKLINAAAQTQ